MNKILLFNQFLGDNKKPNFIMQYYATKPIPFLFGKLNKFYTRSSYSNEAFGKGELIYDKYNEDTNIGKYGLYLDDIVNFYGGFVDKNDRNATIMGCIDLCYDLNDTNDYINIIDEDITIILPNSIEHLLGPVSSGGKVILDSLPENLKSIENYGLHLLKGNGLAIPPSVTNIGKCFDISNGSVMIDNLYFISEFPPNLTEGNIGFDQDTFHEDIKLQICIPIESKDRYLNSDFINHEGRLNFNRIIEDVTTVKVLDNNKYKTIYNKQLYLNDIQSVQISSSTNPNESVTLPNSVENLKIFINRLSLRTKFNNILTITSDIKNIEWTNNNSQLRTLFAKYSEIQFVNGCTTIPNNLISSTYQTGNYDTYTGYWYNKLVIDKNVKNINQIFTDHADSNGTVMLYFIVKSNNYDDFWITLCNLNHPEGGAFSKAKYVNLYFRTGIDTLYRKIDLKSEAITRVNDYAFTNITMDGGSITLGKNINFIGKKAFRTDTHTFQTVYYNNTINNWFKIQMPSSLDEDYEENCAFLQHKTLNISGQEDNFVISEDVEIFNSNLNGFKFTTISINSKTINAKALTKCSYLSTVTFGTNVQTINNFMPSFVQTINYEGTIEQWNAITKAEDWNENIKVTIVTCSDGTVTIRENN